MFNRQTLITMIGIQNKLNQTMGGNAWLQSDNTTRPYYRAAWIEGGEGIAHYGYKWWKMFDRSANLGQVKLEVVDMLHFILSDELRFTFQTHMLTKTGEQQIELGTEEIAAVLSFVDGQVDEGTVNRLIEETADRIIHNGVIDIPESMVANEETFILVAEQFVLKALVHKRVQIKFWGALADALNLNIEEAGIMYLGKAALNFLRDSNGQKEGTYVKMWWGTEDNIYLERWLESYRVGRTIVEDGDVSTAVQDHLQEQYRRLLAGEPALVV